MLSAPGALVRWAWRVKEGAGVPESKLWTSQNFPELPRKFLGDFPGTSLTVDLKSFFFQRFPGSFPDFPGSSPDVNPDLPGCQLGPPQRSAPGV